MLRLLFIAFLLLGSSSGGVYAAPRPYTALNKHAQLLQGSWYSAEGEIAFHANNTMTYRGKKYYCAIAGGMIQLGKKHHTSMIPYRISDDKLILMTDGRETVYSRKR